MTRSFTTLVGIPALVLILGASAGCATTKQLDQVKAMAQQAQKTADEAKTMAQDAANKADQANQHAMETDQKIDKMFKKTMMK